MKSLPNFEPEMESFIQEEARVQAASIVEQKEPNRAAFTIETLRQFSYEEQLLKYQKTTPYLLRAIVGTLSKSRGAKPSDISRKGFGGANRDEEIDLTPCVVQSMSRIHRNRHPSSISLIPCLNSLFMWTNRVTGQIFHWYNSLGDALRLVRNSCFIIRSIGVVFEIML